MRYERGDMKFLKDDGRRKNLLALSMQAETTLSITRRILTQITNALIFLSCLLMFSFACKQEAAVKNRYDTEQIVPKRRVLLSDVWTIRSLTFADPKNGLLHSLGFILKSDTSKRIYWGFHDRGDSMKLFKKMEGVIDHSSSPSWSYSMFTRKYCIMNHSGSQECLIHNEREFNRHVNICEPVSQIFERIIAKNDSLHFDEIVKQLGSSDWEKAWWLSEEFAD
jgi:hypothetical protein